VNYTRAAAEMLFDIKDADRRVEVGDRAERLAQNAGRDKVWIEDVRAAIYCAGEEFMPDEGDKRV